MLSGVGAASLLTGAGGAGGIGFLVFRAATRLARFAPPWVSASLRDVPFGFAGETTTGPIVLGACPLSEAACANTGLSAPISSEKATLNDKAEPESQFGRDEYPRDDAGDLQMLRIDKLLLDGEYPDRQARSLQQSALAPMRQTTQLLQRIGAPRPTRSRMTITGSRFPGSRVVTFNHLPRIKE